MDRWKVYSTLKTGRNLDKSIKEIEILNAHEVKESVLEFLTAIKYDKSLHNRFYKRRY